MASSSGARGGLDTLEQELAWLSARIETALGVNLDRQDEAAAPRDAPDLPTTDDTAYAELVRRLQLGSDERLLLILALARRLKPEVLDPLLARNQATDRPFTEFGGEPGAAGGFSPTLATGVLLLGGRDLSRRLAAERLLDADAPLIAGGVLRPVAPDGDSVLTQPLAVTASAAAMLLHGRRFRPRPGTDFPAKRLTTELEWDDLVLPSATRGELEEILAWLSFGGDLRTDPHLGHRLAPGYRALFLGPPGTGKTLATTLLGKATGRDVYRVDLSPVASKWIGETEKNLAALLDRAAHKGPILLFDEADALFAERKEVADAHDRYADLPVSYLLQQVEAFEGLVVLTSNLRSNSGDGLARHFQSIVRFPMPGRDDRLRLWQNAFPASLGAAADVDLEQLAEHYELTGRSIANVLLHAALAARRDGERPIGRADLQRSIAHEMRKDGRLTA